MKQNHGYTLIEIMVALAVFAVLATITASAMYQAFDTRARVNVQANQLNAIQLALILIARDTEQMVDRAIRGNDMLLFPPFVGQTRYLEFTRGGLVNPNGIERRGTLQRIAYVCSGKTLVRRSWENLDTPNRKQYQDRILLDNLKDCTFAYLSSSRQVLPEWREYAVQQNQKKETLPLAIQFTLTIQNWGDMSLLFAIPEAIYAA